MTDFLTSLVARTIAPPSLTPRLRSRFEPQAFDDSGIVESVREIAIDGPASAAPSLASAPQPAEVADREEIAQSVSVSPRRRESAPPSTRAAEASRVAPPMPRPAETPELASRPEDAVAAPAPQITQPERIAAPLGHRTAALRPAEPAAVPGEHRETRVETRESTRTVERARTIATRIIERSETSRLFAQPPRAATPQAAAAPEPTIHISIGRVEVRAATAPAAVPRAAKRSAVQSLDDYLDRRNRKDGR